VLTGAGLDQAILQLPSRPRRNTFFRAMALRFHLDPLGKKRPINAQRFNVAGGARVLYLGEDQMTCLQEAQALGWPAISTAIVPVQFDLKAIVDLRDPDVQRALQTNSAELAFNFRSLQPSSAPTQILGERCAASGRIDGLLYKSPALAGKVDLAVIEVALSILGSSLTVADPLNNLHDRLP
jgi:RES domain-containing protein